MLSVEGILTGVVGTLITACIAWFGIFRRAKTDEAGLALAAWKELLEPLRKELAETKEELIKTKEELTKLRTHLEAKEEYHKKESARFLKRIGELENINKNR